MTSSVDVEFLISSLGGVNAVAKLFDIAPPSVSAWKKNKKIPKARIQFLMLYRPDLFGGYKKKGA